MSDELKQTGTVRTETYWALVDTLYEARIENHEQATRIAELEGALRQICTEYCRWYDHGFSGDAANVCYDLKCIAAAALTHEEPK